MRHVLKSPYFYVHVIGCILAISVITILVRDLPANVETPQVAPLVNIGIEHTRPVSVFLETSFSRNTGIFDMSHDGDETISLLLPTTWQRREVRNAPLDSMTSEESIFGFTRWHIPSGATVSFLMSSAPRGFSFHNPTLVPLKIDIEKIDIEAGTVDHDVLLVQEKAEKVWD